VKPVYGQHLKQILATIGGSIIASILVALIATTPAFPPQTRAGVEHSGDGRGAAAAPTRALPGQRAMNLV
jgi:hypothetical protein